VAATVRAVAASATSAATTSVTVAKPTGTVDGDVVYFVVSTLGNATVTPPTGLTFLREDANGTASSDSKIRTYRRVASGEPADYTFTFSTSDTHNVAIVAVQGADTTTPEDATTVGQANASSTSCVAPAITTASADTLLLFCGAASAARSWTPPAGMTEQVDVAAGKALTVAAEAVAAAGSTGTRTATLSSARQNCGQLIAVRSAAAAAVPTFRAASSAGPGIVTSVTVAKPTGVVDDDLMVMAIATVGDSTPTLPSGWALHTEVKAGTTENDSYLLVYYKKAASEPADYTISFSTTDNHGVAVAAYDNVHTSSPFDATPSSRINASSTSCTADEVTTGSADAMLVFVGACDASRTFTPPSGMSERADVFAVSGSAGMGLEIADEARPTAGATGTRTATLDTARANTAILLALRAVGSTTAVGQSVQAVWHLRAPAGSPLEARHNTAAVVGKPLEGRWNVLSAVATLLDSRWAELAAVSVQREALFHVRGGIGVLRDGRWHVQTLVALPLAGIWSLRAAASSTFAAVHHVRAAAGQSLEAPWDDRIMASVARAAVWHENALTAHALAASWNDRGAVGSTLDGSWHDRQFVGTPLQALWNGFALAGRSVEGLWNIASTLVVVGSELATLWNTRAGIASPLGARFTSHAALGGSLDARFATLVTAAPSSLQALFHDRGLVGSSLEGLHNLRAPVASSLAAPFGTLVLVTVDSTRQWHVLVVAPGVSLQALYGLRAGAGASIGVVWNGSVPVASARTMLWDDRSAASSALATRWTVFTLLVGAVPWRRFGRSSGASSLDQAVGIISGGLEVQE